jgi:hypothetical protein
MGFQLRRPKSAEINCSLLHPTGFNLIELKAANLKEFPMNERISEESQSQVQDS